MDITKLFDRYQFTARIQPVLLAALPVGITLVTWLPQTFSVNTTLFSVVALSGVVALLADVSRSAGKRTQMKLLQEWGGWPTTILLRHRDTTINAITKARYKETIASKIPNWRIPTIAEETANITRTDEVYATAITWLLEQTRSDELLFKENMFYGFRRNALGIRPWAIALALIAVISAIYLALAFSNPTFWFVVIANCLLFAFWIWTVNAKWVREAADTYALRLLACCEKL